MRNIGNYRVFIIAAVLIFILSSSVMAVNLTPEMQKELYDRGELDRYIELIKDAKLRGVDAPDKIKTKDGLAARAAKAADPLDTLTVLVLLVNFPDHPYTAGEVTDAGPAEFDSVLFSENNPTGSMTEYYLENSYGNMLIVGEVHGWYLMPQPYSYYVDGEAGLGYYPRNSQGLCRDAIHVADSLGLDFSAFDTYGNFGPDSEIDGLMIVHAGPGYENTLQLTDMQSHKWNLGTFYQVVVDGIIIDSYTIQPEERYTFGEISSIGIFCHEFGHVLGLPDLYDVDYTPETSSGIGIWSLMATGCYRGGSKTPSHLDAWSKTYLGFVNPTEIYSNMVEVSFPPVETHPVVYKVWKDGVYGPEYFLVENRQSIGFDHGLPGTGLLIYHVDDATTFSNENVSRYHVAVEQSDGAFQLEYSYNNEGDIGDPWPGYLNKTSFDDLSTPNSRGYGNIETQVSVWNIAVDDTMVTANLDIEWSRPYLEFYSYDFAENNGVLEPGEIVEFYFNIKNYWLDANNATITLTSNDPDIEFITPTIGITQIPGDGEFTENLEAIVFRLPDTLTPSFDSFFVTIVTDGGAFDTVFGIEQQVGNPQILIVDDDRGGDYDSLYVDDLYHLQIPADIWSKSTSGSPPGAILDQYKMVIWITGDTSSDLLQPADIGAMTHYLDNSGNLFLTGQGIAAELHNEDSVFLDEYLHTVYGGALYSFIHQGVDGSPIGDGLMVRFSPGSNQDFNWSSHIIPANGAVPAFENAHASGYYTGLSFSGGYKLVFFNWGYEGLASDLPNYARRDTVLARIIDFFSSLTTEVADDKDQFALPKTFELSQNFPNPFNPFTTIEYTLRSTNGGPIPSTVLKIYNVLGQDIKTLVNERQRPGVYRVQWDGTNDSGKMVASGIYFYSLYRGANRETRKMVLLK